MLQGSGLPVNTSASVSGDSLTPSTVDATLRGQCVLRDDSEFEVPGKDLGRDIVDVLLRVIDDAGDDIAFARAVRRDDLGAR